MSDTGSRFSEVIFGVTSSSIVFFRCLDLISGNIFLGLLENNHIANKKCLEANWSEEMMVYPISVLMILKNCVTVFCPFLFLSFYKKKYPFVYFCVEH